jgi:hypothetical protein
MSDTEMISLIGSLDGEWIKLPLAVMREVGPAVQTLGGLLKVTKKETFTAVGEISAKAHLPVGTVRRHLRTLDKAGWISNRGRGKTRRGLPRRTATLAITQKTLLAIDNEANSDTLVYGILPTWACCSFPWCAKAVLSILLARLAALKAGAQQQSDCDGSEALIDAIEKMGGEERFRFSVGWLVRQTGLTHDSVTSAKGHLHKLSIVDWRRGNRDDGGTATDLLVPNWDFPAPAAPALAMPFWLDFHGGGEK